jgi:hypothetical protein
LCSLNVLPARLQILGSPRLFIDMIASTGSRHKTMTYKKGGRARELRRRKRKV